MEVLFVLAFIFFVGCFIAFVTLAAVVGVLALFLKLILFVVLLPFILLGLLIKIFIWVILLPFKLLGGVLHLC